MTVASVHGILQARILEWVAISFSRGSSRLRDRTQVSCIAGRCFNLWATREDLYKYSYINRQSNQNTRIWCFGRPGVLLVVWKNKTSGKSETVSHSIVSNSVTSWTVACQTSLSRGWILNSCPCKNTEVGSHSLLQGIFPTQVLKLGLPRCGQILYRLSHQGSPKTLERYLTDSHRIA